LSFVEVEDDARGLDSPRDTASTCWLAPCGPPRRSGPDDRAGLAEGPVGVVATLPGLPRAVL